ncbi:tyrosine-type recombinase/integrase [Mesorhizobium sp.]|uniref:tyrosine-type recombinase/integrase n=1 Tax=Mesorhizobium sp. TaxID=1871066 RepID=UPI0025B93A88|nr:tyrosine-type recombinase/integrase [Mesorhizobium sp.]
MLRIHPIDGLSHKGRGFVRPFAKKHIANRRRPIRWLDDSSHGSCYFGRQLRPYFIRYCITKRNSLKHSFLFVFLSPNSFVVAQVDGAPLQPRSLTHEWVRVLGKTTLPRIRFHDLRHTHASQMLSAGVHPKVASERLGHSSIGITLDLYSHVMPGMQADAAEQVDAALQAAISSERKVADGLLSKPQRGRKPL